jgi:hypothetical protein
LKAVDLYGPQVKALKLAKEVTYRLIPLPSYWQAVTANNSV